MATKTPLKTAKAATKKTTPAKSSGGHSNSGAKNATAKAPASKAGKATIALTTKPTSKTPDLTKKSTTKPSAAAVGGTKKASEVQQQRSKDVKASPEKAKQLHKPDVVKKEAARPVEPISQVVTGNQSGKQIIVPSKPAINPRPSKADKLEGPKTGKLVEIPRTSTDKKVDYEPEFTKSVLDTPAQQPSNPTMRYSDSELQEFRDLINKKLEAAKKELAYLQGLITRKDEMGGDETDNRYMTMEDGSMSMEREQLSQMASRQITFIDHLEKAIMRIENKTYGICRVTGKLIDKARLRAVPHATLSMEAKLGIVK